MRQFEEDTVIRLRKKGSKAKVEPLLIGYDSNGLPLATVEALPDELLLEIFELASSGWPSTRSAPLNVSSTCRRWRELALSMSELWARLDDREADELGQRRHINGRLATLWLKRAGDFAMLHVSVKKLAENCLPFDFEDVVELRSFIHAIWKLQPRLRVLALPRISWLQFPDHIRLGKVPGLTELNLPMPIHIRNGDMLSATLLNGPLVLAPLYDPLEGPIAPRLRILECGIWRNESDEERGLLNLLRHCPCLCELAIAFRSVSLLDDLLHDEDIDLPECFLPSLKKLRANGRLGHLLSRKVKAPNLEEIILAAGGNWERYTIPIDHILRFIRNSRPKPRRVVILNVGGKYLHHSSLEDNRQTVLFEALSDETQELILGFHAKSSTFELLSLDPSGGRCLPKLKHLTLNVPASTDWVTLQRMLSSRFNESETFRARLVVRATRSQMMSHPGFFKTFVGCWEADERLQIDYVRQLDISHR